MSVKKMYYVMPMEVDVWKVDLDDQHKPTWVDRITDYHAGYVSIIVREEFDNEEKIRPLWSKEGEYLAKQYPGLVFFPNKNFLMTKEKYKEIFNENDR